MPKISVVIPVYNVEEYLPRCLNSIINQTFKNLGIICVDDGSPDNSAVILAQYAQKDKRIKIISQKNAGLSACKLKTQPQQKYERYYRFTLLSIPIITVYRKKECCRDTVSYKAYIFDKIPVAKLLLSKCQNE